MNQSPFTTQIGGDHYKDLPIQPAEYCQKNKLNFCEASVVAYVTRHQRKGGSEDIRKAIHFLELLLEMEYPEETSEPTPESSKLHNPDSIKPEQVGVSCGWGPLYKDEMNFTKLTTSNNQK